MGEMQLGLSPCPNDTFIFHALLHGLVRLPGWEQLAVKGYFADVEQLNARALARQLPVTKLSLGVMPLVRDSYAILNSGGALGWGCGPLIVARPGKIHRSSASIAIPGRHTTAALLLNLVGEFQGARREMLFSDIMPAVARGEVDLGVIIHEGRFTFEQYGLVKVLDLGQWWEEHYKLPLPLGCIAVRRDVDPDLGRALELGIASSLAFAWAHPDASGPFIRAHAQELDAAVTQAHIDTFVTSYSKDLGEQGRESIRFLLNAAPGAPSGALGLFWGE